MKWINFFGCTYLKKHDFLSWQIFFVTSSKIVCLIRIVDNFVYSILYVQFWENWPYKRIPFEIFQSLLGGLEAAAKIAAVWKQLSTMTGISKFCPKTLGHFWIVNQQITLIQTSEFCTQLPWIMYSHCIFTIMNHQRISTF